jgi:hypothetical protein
MPAMLAMLALVILALVEVVPLPLPWPLPLLALQRVLTLSPTLNWIHYLIYLCPNHVLSLLFYSVLVVQHNASYCGPTVGN